MKKIYAMLLLCGLSMSAIATVTTLPSGEDLTTAIGSAAAGDTLLLQDGTFTMSATATVSNPLTIMAADGASPVVNLHRIEPNAEFKAVGIKFVGNGSSHCIRTTVGGTFSVRFENCHFVNTASTGRIYYLSSGQTLDNLSFDNCILDGSNTESGAIYSYGTLGSLRITNSTIMNHTQNLAIQTKTVTNLLIDHCTFYNNGPRVIYSKCENAVVTNCVISNPAMVGDNGFCTYYGTLSNCVYYNTGAPHSGPTITNVAEADPLFIDPNNGNLNFQSTSPLLNAATDGTHIGDPRWHVAEAQMVVSLQCLGSAEKATDNYTIAFSAVDPSASATVTLAYSADQQSWTTIIDQLSSAAMQYEWNIRTMPAGDYYLQAVLANATDTVRAVSVHPLTIVPDTEAPRAITDLTAFADNQSVRLTWSNPTHSVPCASTIYEKTLGMSNIEFYTSPSESASANVEVVTDGLQVTYQTQVAWADAGVKIIPANPAEVLTDLSFRLKGNGKAHNIRVTVEQNGADWWYQYVSLENTEWQNVTADNLKKLTWHNNLPGEAFDGTNITAVYLVVSVMDATAEGTFVIDNVQMSGLIPPVADFVKTTIVRSTTAYPATIADGTVVYEGTDEVYEDTNLEQGTYYYAAFAADDLGNISDPATCTATVQINETAMETVHGTDDAVVKRIENGQLYIIRGSMRYSVLGTEIR